MRGHSSIFSASVFFVVLLNLSLISQTFSDSSVSKSKEHTGRTGSTHGDGGKNTKSKVSSDADSGNRSDTTKQSDINHLLQDADEFADSTLSFWHAFVASISVILVSEIGDKTFFIAAIMAMRHSRLTVFAGALSALFLMTVLSATLGWATQIIPRKFTYYVSTFLFALFGLKMLKEGWAMSPTEGQEEYEEALDDIKKREDQLEKTLESEVMISGDVESGQGRRRQSTVGVVLRFVSKIYIEAFTLTFLAEWGDRSQLTTIILAARENVAGVTLGGTLGHAMCTGVAVLGGRIIAQRISVRTVTLVGGVVFLLFALSALILNPES
jgi:putative Ca2+/H+ antiporter (TMEM165/GDT1 family)